MRPTLLTLPLAICGTLLLANAASAADTLTVTIKGTIQVAAKCDFEPVNPDLGTVDSSVFTNIGDASPWVDMNIKSKGCSPSTKGMNWTYGTLADADPNNPNLFKVNGDAKGIGIELKYTRGQSLKPGTAGIYWNPRPAGGIYDHQIRYVKTKDVIVGGNAGTTFTITIDYL